jgi:hypothetical protein
MTIDELPRSPQRLDFASAPEADPLMDVDA